MALTPVLLAFVILGAAVAAMSMRNLIHSVLLLIVTWFGIGLFYLWAGAEFLAFAQILVYVGAISMVVLFAVLLTRRSASEEAAPRAIAGRTAAALVAAGAIWGILATAILGKGVMPRILLSTESNIRGMTPSISVRQIGTQIMGPQFAALLVIGVILTVALLGGVVLAATGRRVRGEEEP